MTVTKKAFIKLGSIYQLLLEPDRLINGFIKGRKVQSIYLAVLYILVGYMFQHNWPFPYFSVFSLCFALIGIAAIFFINHFSVEMRIITSTLITQKPAERANTIYYSYGKKSVCYIWIPLAVVCVFGYGGCSIFGALQVTPTLIWMLSLFTVVVYVSIIGYLKYIVLALYIYKLAMSKFMYAKLPKSSVECIPIQLKWIQELTKLYHTYRSAFFTVGGAYIFAYSLFCWLPKMEADISAPWFFILWSIISLAVILVFPIISLLEYQWIKKIVGQLKCSYINDLCNENRHIHIKLKKDDTYMVEQKVMTTMYAIQIMGSQDYPIKSLLSTGYSICITAFNVIASVVTIVSGLSMLPNDFHHIF